MTQHETLLQRPLYVFDLPEEILYTLSLQEQPLDAATTSETPPHTSSQVNELHAPDREDEPKAATACSLCGLAFADLQEQRSHVRSDLHGYNIKQKIRGRAVVNEMEFEKLIGQLDESISGSDTSDSEESDNDGDFEGRAKESTLSALLKRQAKLVDGDAEDSPAVIRKKGSGKPPIIWFQSPKLPTNTSLGIYRAIFSASEQDQEHRLTEVLRGKQLSPEHKTQPKQDQSTKGQDDGDGGVPLPLSTQRPVPASVGPHYFLCMIGGGHFAAMVVALTPKINRKGAVEDRSASVVVHKTFHRYTTRRKQGGSQSANDNSKGNAHSAGSSLRRYNEAALEKDVRDLLAEWKSLIDTADLLFIRATGTTNRRTLYGPYDGQVLSSRDARVRGFPFSTRRATQSELMRAFVELTRVKVNTVDEAEIARRARDAAALSTADSTSTTKSAKPKTPKLAKPSKADEEATLHTTQLQALIRRSKAPAMLSYLESNGLDPGFSFFPVEMNYHAPTPLHLAAASNSAPCVNALLIKARADPSQRNNDGKTAFEIAGDRATRDAFRVARAELGEDRWSWDAAGVPSALTRQETEARAAREKEEKSAEEASEKQRRAAEVERLRREDNERLANQRDSKFGKGHTMGEVKLTAEERRMEQARGMSDEMRMRLEREKRARAAEERIRRMQNK